MSRRDMFKAVEVLSKLEAAKAKKRQGRKGAASVACATEVGSTNANVGRQIGLDASTVAQIKKLQASASNEVLEEVFDGRLSIRAAYDLIIGMDKPARKTEDTPASSSREEDPSHGILPSEDEGEDKDDKGEDAEEGDGIGDDNPIDKTPKGLKSHSEKKRNRVMTRKPLPAPSRVMLTTARTNSPAGHFRHC